MERNERKEHMDQILNGTNPTADQRLMEAVDAADPFDGGCPADVGPRDWDTEMAAIHLACKQIGVHDAIAWLRANDCPMMANELSDAHRRGEVLK